MAYRVTHWTGEMESEYPPARFSSLLAELSVADGEHPDVSVIHESEWSLTVYRSGFLVLENLEEGEPVHLNPLSTGETIALMVKVAEGKIDEVRSLPWRQGYPPKPTR